MGEVKKLISDEIHKKYAEDWKKAVGNAYAQDKINQEISDETRKIEKSYIDFKGQKTPWEVSIIDREFAHGNGEAMLVIEEGMHKQRRFLFFYNEKLYKQFIAFDKELFQGKNFDQFAQIIQNRYGRGVAKYKLNRKGEQILEHLEWPPSGATLLRAVDQSNFYDTFCLVIEDRGVSQVVAPRHKENALGEGAGSAIVRDIQAPEKVSGDVNSDIVDRITGRGKGSEETPPPAASEPARISNSPSSAPPQPATQEKKQPAKTPAKKDTGKKLEDLEL